MRINDLKRKEIWNEYCKLENMMRELKSIVQNSIEITPNDFGEHIAMTYKIKSKLDNLNITIGKEIQDKFYANEYKEALKKWEKKFFKIEKSLK